MSFAEARFFFDGALECELDVRGMGWMTSVRRGTGLSELESKFTFLKHGARFLCADATSVAQVNLIIYSISNTFNDKLLSEKAIQLHRLVVNIYSSVKSMISFDAEPPATALLA